MFTEQRNVEPEVFAEAALNAFALCDAFFHTTADDVAASQFLLLGFHIGHEAMSIAVTQKSTVTAATFCYENTSGENARRVELNSFHVAQRCNTAFESKCSTRAFANLRIRCNAEEFARTARANRCGFSNIGEQLAIDEVTNNRAVATLAVMDKR